MFNKIFLIFLVVIFNGVSVLNPCHASTNLALSKTYITSKKPNYKLSSSSEDVTSLTDGKYTKGHFWTEKSTVGWLKSGPIEICIDLGKSYNIDSIAFSTARRKEAGVYFPAHIAAFVGADKSHLRYLGNIADDPENVSGSYRTKKFKLSDLSASGRYVFLVIHPEGPHLFCDEIEVFEGQTNDGIGGNLSIENARIEAENFRRDDLNKRFLASYIQELKYDASHFPQLASTLLDIGQRLHAPNEDIDRTDNIEKELFGLRGKILRARHSGDKFILSQADPWARVGSVHPVTESLIGNLSLALPIRGHDYAAFWLTNLATKTRTFHVKLDKPAQDLLKLSIYQVPFVKTASMEQVPDPLLPLNDGIILLPGESRLVLIKGEGVQSGTWRGALAVASDDYKKSVPLVCRIVKTALPDRFALNSVNWNYLNFKPTRNKKKEAMNDLFTHHTNVGVIHPSSLPPLGKTSAMDFARLKGELELQKGAAKILIMMNYGDNRLRTAGDKYTFLSAPWKENFRRFYAHLIYIAGTSGFTREQIYLYPYDEMGGAEIDQFIALATWIRKEMPGTKLYATLGKKGSHRALPFLDIAQVINDRRLKNFDNRLAEIWLYDTKGPAKSLSPFAYYRKMAWQAFYGGYRGIGFWAYADTGWHSAPSSAWDDFDGNYPDFAVIYEGENGIISSRRWEAWMLGVEDFELLKMYTELRGEEAAKKYVELVLEHPENSSLAHGIRKKVLLELADAVN